MFDGLSLNTGDSIQRRFAEVVLLFRASVTIYYRAELAFCVSDFGKITSNDMETFEADSWIFYDCRSQSGHGWHVNSFQKPWWE